MPHMDMFIFDFCANIICTKCALLDAEAKTYRRVIIPISLRSQLVLQSCLAAAANQMKRHQSHYSQSALRYRGSYLKSLHRHIAYLSSGQIPTMIANKTEILGAILMLCFFDYSNESSQESLAHRYQVGWKAHLLGTKRILDLKTTSESPQCDRAVT
ncbi:Fc.00g097660.m01.CDS01 [Cosmosporella sp. VM-42]